VKGLLAALLVLLLATAPATAGPPDGVPKPVTDALDAGSRRAAIAILEDAASATTDPQALPWILLYAGEMYRLAEDLPEARRRFETVAGDWPSSPARGPAVLGLAVVDSQGRPGGNGLATLGLIGDANVPDTLNADRYLLLAQAKAAQGAPAEEVAALARKARSFAAEDREVNRRVGRATDGLLTKSRTEAGGPRPKDLVAIEEIRADLAARRFDDAARKATEFPTTFADSPFVTEAAYAVRRAAKKVAPDPKKVAVLLPLTGDYALPAANLRAAIEMANEDAQSPATLVFQDTAGKPEQCVRMLEAAVIDLGAAYVIGPLRKEEALVCAPAAQALHVPMLTLSSSPELAAIGDVIFRPFPSTEEQIQALLDEVYDHRGMHSFAILNPKTAYGENAARAFTEAVQRRGGVIAQAIGYDPASTDFRATAKLLGRTDYKARAAEFASLKAQAASHGGDPTKVVLPPTVDFEGIFIPDSYQRVALVASALAFQEFPVGAFRPHAGDAPITLLGLNAWNNEDLARRGGNYVVGSIFVDAFDPHATDPATSRFVDRWRDRGAGDPSVVEAVGYDTMALVGLAVKAGGDPSTALLAAQMELGVAGTRRFAPDRHVERTWRLLTVTKAGIEPLGADVLGSDEGAAPQ
jgi:ABC-type branched-subunit amino acid transport system substrate-binding protein